LELPTFTSQSKLAVRNILLIAVWLSVPIIHSAQTPSDSHSTVIDTVDVYRCNASVTRQGGWKQYLLSLPPSIPKKIDLGSIEHSQAALHGNATFHFILSSEPHNHYNDVKKGK
jgi:hypothetical protein